LSSMRGIALGIFVADCAPVFVALPDDGIVGILHAGWKGLAAGIIQKACDVLSEKVGKQAVRKLRVAIGPHIGSCCYEVGQDVARLFPNSVKLKDDAPSWRLDLSHEIAGRFSNYGINPKSIDDSDFCTMHDIRFFSHRRNKDQRRMLAYIART